MRCWCGGCCGLRVRGYVLRFGMGFKHRNVMYHVGCCALTTPKWPYGAMGSMIVSECFLIVVSIGVVGGQHPMGNVI